jgi:hypothetical protein
MIEADIIGWLSERSKRRKGLTGEGRLWLKELLDGTFARRLPSLDFMFVEYTVTEWDRYHIILNTQYRVVALPAA